MKIETMNKTAALLLLLVTTSAQADLGRIVGKFAGEKLGLDRGAPVAEAPALPGAGFHNCPQHFPNDKPVPAKFFSTQTIQLCSDAFASVYSPGHKTPLVVIERLTRDKIKAAKGLERTNAFFSDPRLGREGTSPNDYRGFDRGHMAPAADMPSTQAMAQSFVLSNIIPQDSDLNQNAWAKIESDVRKYVMRAQGDVFVFTGPLFFDNRVTGRGIRIPTHVFKLVLDGVRGTAWAYILPNQPGQTVQPPMDYASFVRFTGYDLFSIWN